MARFTRQQILDRLNAKIRNGQPIVGGGAGTGLSAKCEEAGGIDLIVIYNSGRYRMAGRGSLSGLMPYGNANDIVMEMAREVLAGYPQHTCPGRRQRHRSLLHLRPFSRPAQGRGVCRGAEFPHGGPHRRHLPAKPGGNRMGFGLEVDMIRLAHEKDMLTTPYVFSEDDAIAMTEAGADVIVCHLGLTTGGNIGADTAKTLDDCVD